MKPYAPELTFGPVTYKGEVFSFAERCPQTKTGKHVVETIDDFGEPLPAPWCRQCGLEGDSVNGGFRGDA